jgi:hypothetical protein
VVNNGSNRIYTFSSIFSAHLTLFQAADAYYTLQFMTPTIQKEKSYRLSINLALSKW